MRLSGRGATEERRAMHHGIDAPHRRIQGAGPHQVAFHEDDARAGQPPGAVRVAHHGTHRMPCLRQPPGEPASHFSGRTGQQNVHAVHDSRRTPP